MNKLFTKLEKLIKSKDSKNLVKWLKSTVPEIQLYAIDGILTLKKQGIVFNKDVLKLVDVISKKKGEVYTCNRCIYSNKLIINIEENIIQHFSPSFYASLPDSSVMPFVIVIGTPQAFPSRDIST